MEWFLERQVRWSACEATPILASATHGLLARRGHQTETLTHRTLRVSRVADETVKIPCTTNRRCWAGAIGSLKAEYLVLRRHCDSWGQDIAYLSPVVLCLAAWNDGLPYDPHDQKSLDPHMDLYLGGFPFGGRYTVRLTVRAS